jgi:hypothetical protein
MQTGLDTEIASIKENDIILCDATVTKDAKGLPTPAKGDRLLLVRILEMKDPKALRDYSSRPSVRLETFERRDTLLPSSEGLSGSRSFGLDKRLVIASRSVAPEFKILLYPYRSGDPLPETKWNEDRSVLTISTPSGTSELAMSQAEGRTVLNPRKK